VIEPLHVATVDGQPLRFFRTPLNDGRPDLPWHCVDDLHRCLGLDRNARRAFLRRLQNAREWGKDVRTVATADGLITIAPHYMAQGWVDAMIHEGMAPARVRREYDLAGTDAMKKLGVPFPFGSDEFFAWMKAAMNRWA
jgi:hypothetical protein